MSGSLRSLTCFRILVPLLSPKSSARSFSSKVGVLSPPAPAVQKEPRAVPGDPSSQSISRSPSPEPSPSIPSSIPNPFAAASDTPRAPPTQSLSQIGGINGSAFSSRGSPSNPFASLSPTHAQFDKSFTATADYLERDILSFKKYILHIKAGYNNTLVTVTNQSGMVLATSSGGKAGFKKAQRAGYEPAYQATTQVLSALEAKLGNTSRVIGLHLKFNGFGPGRDAAWKCTMANQWKVIMVEDVTPIAFAGCRPRKARRL